MSELMARVAKTDHDRVFWGLGDPVAPEALKAGDFVFGDRALAAKLPAGAFYIDLDCDAAPGQYRFVEHARVTEAPAPGAMAIATYWRLEPLPRGLVKSQPDELTAERALYEQLRLVHETNPAGLAPLARAWAKAYESTWDADNGRLLQYFRALDQEAAK